MMLESTFNSDNVLYPRLSSLRATIQPFIRRHPKGTCWNAALDPLRVSTLHRCRSIFSPLCFLTRSKEEIEVTLNQRPIRQRWQASEGCDLHSALLQLKETGCSLSDIPSALNQNTRLLSHGRWIEGGIQQMVLYCFLSWSKKGVNMNQSRW